GRRETVGRAFPRKRIGLHPGCCRGCNQPGLALPALDAGVPDPPASASGGIVRYKALSCAQVICSLDSNTPSPFASSSTVTVVAEFTVRRAAVPSAAMAVETPVPGNAPISPANGVGVAIVIVGMPVPETVPPTA